MSIEKVKTFIPYIIIALLIILIFGKVGHLGYTWSDDNYFISKQHYFMRDLRNIPNAFLQDGFISSGKLSNYYRPMNIVSYIVDAQYCQTNPSCYHLTTFIVHIIFSLILFIFLQKIGISRLIALLLTLLFSVHPTITSTVAWIPGRIDSLPGVFFLASFLFFLKWERYVKRRFAVFHIIFFNLALYSKETALLFPIIIVMYYLIVKRQYLFKKPLIPIYYSWFVSFLIWYILRWYALRNSSITILNQLSTNDLSGIFVYIGKIIPIGLSVLPILKDSSIVPGILVSFLLLVGLYIFRKHFRTILYGYMWFLFLIMPSVIQSKLNMKFLLEHRDYLPFVGILIAVGNVLPTKGRCHKMTVVVMIFIISAFSYITFKRIDYYQSPLTFHTQAIRESPHSAEAFETLGYFYLCDNNPDKAKPLFHKALELNPNVQKAHTNLGIILLNEGKYEEAEKEILKEQSINNDYTLFHLGIVYYAQGKKLNALNAWKQSYALSPNYLPVVINLASVNADLKNYNEAKKFYDQAVALSSYDSSGKIWLEKIKFLEDY